MTQEEYKEYRSHLDAIREMSAKDGIKFFYTDDRGNMLISDSKSSVLETLLVGNMYRQDAFRDVILRCIKYYFEFKDEMTDSIRAVREEDSRNIAEKMINDLLKENGFKQSENKQ